MSTTQPAATAWYRTITADQWRVLAAAKVGWMLDAMDFMLYAMALGQLRAYFELDDAGGGIPGHRDARDVGRRRPRVRLRRGPLRPHARADGHDRDLLIGFARRLDVAERAAAALLACRARHRHGRGMGVGRRARQRDVAAAAPQQGDQHHAVGLGDRLRRGGAARRGDLEPTVARRRGLALAFRRRRRASAVRDLDQAQRAGVAGVERARETAARRGAESVSHHLRPEAASAVRCVSSRSAAPCSSRTGAYSSGCRRSCRDPSSRAAPAWASSARCSGSC